MNIEVVTKGFQKTDSMSQYLQAETLDVIEPFLKNDRDVHLRVIVDEISHRTDGRKPQFVCEILLKTAASKRFFKVQKNSSDFREAVTKASQAMREILRRRSGKRNSQRLWDSIHPAA